MARAARGDRASLLPVGAALVVLAVLLDLAGTDSLFNVAKLLALTAVGFLFMQLFEALSWVVLVAVVIPWVDALSVWRGPTDYVVSEQPSLFDRISIAFRLPGEDGSANIGPPDILFFALFLAAADRFELRVGWTWLSMVGLLALTLILTTSFDDQRPPRASCDRARLPAPERRPALEGVAGARPRAEERLRSRREQAQAVWARRRRPRQAGRRARAG